MQRRQPIVYVSLAAVAVLTVVVFILHNSLSLEVKELRASTPHKGTVGAELTANDANHRSLAADDANIRSDINALAERLFQVSLPRQCHHTSSALLRALLLCCPFINLSTEWVLSICG